MRERAISGTSWAKAEIRKQKAEMIAIVATISAF